jgi:Zn-dependent M28 family amino/carboxypeptidase
LVSVAQWTGWEALKVMAEKPVSSTKKEDKTTVKDNFDGYLIRATCLGGLFYF